MDRIAEWRIEAIASTSSSISLSLLSTAVSDRPPKRDGRPGLHEILEQHSGSCLVDRYIGKWLDCAAGRGGGGRDNEIGEIIKNIAFYYCRRVIGKSKPGIVPLEPGKGGGKEPLSRVNCSRYQYRCYHCALLRVSDCCGYTSKLILRINHPIRGEVVTKNHYGCINPVI